jgi:hypothetical protein
MVRETTESGKGLPSKGTASVPITVPICAASTRKVSPQTVVYKVRLPCSSWNLQKSIEVPDQSGIDNAEALVLIIPMVLPDQLINKIKRRNHNVCSEDVSLNDHKSGFHLGPCGSDAFLCPPSDPTLRVAWRHFSLKNTKKNIPKKKCHN